MKLLRHRLTIQGKVIIFLGLITTALYVSPIAWAAVMLSLIWLTFEQIRSVNDWKQVNWRSVGITTGTTLLLTLFIILTWLSHKHQSINYLLMAWWVFITLVVTALCIAIYFLVDNLATKKRFVTYLKQNTIRYIKKGEDLLEILNGAKDRTVDPDTGDLILLEDGFIATYRGILWKWMRVLWIGFYLNHEILTWKEELNTDNEEILNHPLAIRHQITKPDPEKYELEMKRTVVLLSVGIEIEGNLSIDLAIQFDLEMVNAYDPLWEYLPHGNYAKQISGTVNEVLQDYLGYEGSEFEDLVSRKHSNRRGQSDMFQKMFEPYGLAENAIAGFVMRKFRLLDFDVSLDEQSQAVIKAIRAEAIKTREAKGEAAFLKEIKRVSANWPEFVQYKFSEAAKNWQAVAIDKTGILSLNT
jgi:hypothetical protein